MMSTTNKVFIDSSLLVENIKGNKQKLLLDLLKNETLLCCINDTVISEFLFNFLKVEGTSSPQSLKSSRKIASIFSASENYNILRLFHVISSDTSILSLVPKLMVIYNLLPNDAIILATCKIHNITKLASHDADFIIPCKAEGIELLREE